MTTRHNLCTNPAVTNNITGWGGGSTPTQVTASGFGRSTAARYTTGPYASTAATATEAVTAGLSYTMSVHIKTATFNVPSGTIYVEWINGAGSGFGYPSSGYALTAGVVGRASITATAPTGAVAARIICDGINFSINVADFTMALIEAADLGTYFDGDSPNGSWDGAPGNSASTLTDSPSYAAAGSLQANAALTATAAQSNPSTGSTRAAAILRATTTQTHPAPTRLTAAARLTGLAAATTPLTLAAGGATTLRAAAAQHLTASCSMAGAAALTGRRPPTGTSRDLPLQVSSPTRGWAVSAPFT